jgi:hypothetical protein
MKKVKRYEDGGDVSLEKKYPGAKITRLDPQSKPVETTPKTTQGELSKQAREQQLKKSLEKTAKPEYEQKAEKFERTKTKSGGGGGGVMPIDKMLKMNKMNYKAGGSVSSASKRADGCAIKGKTKGKMV